MFKCFYEECLLLNQDDTSYYTFSSEDEFINMLNENLDDSEGFILVSKENSFALQAGYDYTDYFYFLDEEVKNCCKNAVYQKNIFLFD